MRKNFFKLNMVSFKSIVVFSFVFSFTTRGNAAPPIIEDNESWQTCWDQIQKDFSYLGDDSIEQAKFAMNNFNHLTQLTKWGKLFYDSFQLYLYFERKAKPTIQIFCEDKIFQPNCFLGLSTFFGGNNSICNVIHIFYELTMNQMIQTIVDKPFTYPSECMFKYWEILRKSLRLYKDFKKTSLFCDHYFPKEQPQPKKPKLDTQTEPHPEVQTEPQPDAHRTLDLIGNKW